MTYLGALLEPSLGRVIPLRVKLIQAKLELIGKGPLKVVNQGPIHEASHVVAILYCLLHLYSQLPASLSVPDLVHAWYTMTLLQTTLSKQRLEGRAQTEQCVHTHTHTHSMHDV